MIKTIIDFVLKFLGYLFNRNRVSKWETKQREDANKAERDIRDAIDKVGPSPDIDVNNGNVKDRPKDDPFNNKKWNN